MKKLVAGFIIGSTLTMATSLYAADRVKQYLLHEADYPLYVDGTRYVDGDLPVLNYEGRTYIPLANAGGLLGAGVKWNEAERRVELSSQPAMYENTAFRVRKVTGSGGHYTVTGEARVFEAVMQYRVTDGHDYLLNGMKQVSAGAPVWAPFELKLDVPANRLPQNGTLHVELYESSAKDGTAVHVLSVPLETFR